MANGQELLFWKKGSERMLYNGKSVVLSDVVYDVSLSNDREYIISTSNGLFSLSSKELNEQIVLFNQKIM